MAGIGEHSARVRAEICARLGFVGIELDPEANDRAAPDATISPDGTSPRVIVLLAHEDVVAARAARGLLSQ